jgi:hypothetical protein
MGGTRSKKGSEERQTAVEMYVRGGSFMTAARSDWPQPWQR